VNTGRIRLRKVLKVGAVLLGIVVVIVSVVVGGVVCGTLVVGCSCSVANVSVEVCAHFELATAFFYDNKYFKVELTGLIKLSHFVAFSKVDFPF